MTNWKIDDQVRVVTRPVTAEDRAKNRYYEHMAGKTGKVQAVFGPDEIAVKVDPSSLNKVAMDVHKEAGKRMMERFMTNTSEEQKGKLTPEELAFEANYVLLVRGEDLEKA